VFDGAWVAAVKPIADLHTAEGQRIRIRSNLSIGRTDVNDLVLSDIKVSRRHALIQKQGNSELYLVDLGSRNGTYLNGNRITSPTGTLLRDQDVIDIGPHRLVLSQPNAPRRDQEDRSTLDRTVFGV
jgi:adenylate cyclase